MYQFALIGCGRIANRHAENIQRIGRLVAVCDVIPEKAEAFAKEYGARAYYSIDDLLSAEKEVEVISICTPNGYHAEHSIKSLQAGKHVLCEKPLCITGAAAWQIIETEKFSRKKLFVVKSARFNPLLMELKDKLDKGDLGTVYSFQLNCFWNRPDTYYTDWHGKKFPDGGTLYTQFSHYIDTLVWLFGTVSEVKGFCSNAAHQQVMEFEDTGVASLKMENGTLGTLNWSVNSFEKNAEIGLTVLAEKGTISLGGEYLNKVNFLQSAVAFNFDMPDANANDYAAYKGSMSHHKEMYEQLEQALQNGANSFTNAYDGLRTVETIEKIYKAVTSTFTDTV